MAFKKVPPASSHRRALANAFDVINQNFAEVEANDLSPYYFEKVSGVVITGTDEGSATTVIELITPSLPAGTYHLGYSLQVTYSAKNSEGYFKLDGTFPDTHFFSEAATDNTALHRNRYYAYPKVFGGGIVTMQLKMYMPLNTLTADFADLFIMRVA